jgi:hypothetical protein
LHNKPKAAVLDGAFMLTGPREEKDEEEEEVKFEFVHSLK